MKVVLAFFLVVSTLGIGTSQSFADHSEVTIEAALGSGAPGCEDTAEGCYIPSIATVDVGGKVIMSNPDTAAHTFTAGSPTDGPTGEFDSGLIMAGGLFEYSPDTVGEIPYFCMVHPWMIGNIIVGSEGRTPYSPPSTGESSTTSMQDDSTLKVENQKLKEEIRDLKLENRQLKNQITSLNSEIDSLKDQIVSMTKEFVNSLQQLNEWFRSQLN